MPPTQNAVDLQRLYRQRLHRFVTAMANETPDRVPIRPFLAEFCARHCGWDCMQVTHDYNRAFDAVCQVAKDYDCDALVGNMVWCWTGLTQTLGLKYYGIPGIHCPADHGFQYLEPPEDQAWMKPEEYDHLIEDPTGYLFSVWLGRISDQISSVGEPATYRNQLALIKGGMAMLQYFTAFGQQRQRMQDQCAMPNALWGILKAPLDILADKLRGYMGLAMDLNDRPDKVLAACRALAPHLMTVALASADPLKQLPIGHWMHRSCTPLVTPDQFHEFHWATLKPIIENLWAAGHQTLFYAEGNWNAHLESFAELPAKSIIYHVDRDDLADVSQRLGHKFCISGGVPNTALAFGTPDEVRQHCRQAIDAAGRHGGFIMDAAAIVQNDAKPENIAAMVEATRQFGDYGTPACEDDPPSIGPAPDFQPTDISDWNTGRAPGVCIPWAEKLAESPAISDHPDLAQTIWNNIESLGYAFIWHVLVSF